MHDTAPFFENFFSLLNLVVCFNAEFLSYFSSIMTLFCYSFVLATAFLLFLMYMVFALDRCPLLLVGFMSRFIVFLYRYRTSSTRFLAVSIASTYPVECVFSFIFLSSNRYRHFANSQLGKNEILL